MKVARVGHSNTLPRRLSPAGIGGSVAIPGIEDLTDVDLTTPPDDGDVLIWDDATDTWVPGPPGAVSLELDDLTDVIIAAPAEGDMLRYDGSDWVNYSGHYEPVVADFGSGPEIVFDAGDIVMEWFD